MTDRKIINNWLYAFARDVDKRNSPIMCWPPETIFGIFFHTNMCRVMKVTKRVQNLTVLSTIKLFAFMMDMADRLLVSLKPSRSQRHLLIRNTSEVVRIYNIVAKDFSWTYVKTHENGWYGPYFCYRIPEIWAVRKDKK